MHVTVGGSQSFKQLVLSLTLYHQPAESGLCYTVDTSIVLF